MNSDNFYAQLDDISSTNSLVHIDENPHQNSIQAAHARLTLFPNSLPPRTINILRSTLDRLQGRGQLNYATWILRCNSQDLLFRMAQYIVTHVLIPGS